MNQPPENLRPWKKNKLGTSELKVFIVAHLDRIHGAKLHLTKMMPTLASKAEFSELVQVIGETVADVEKQIARIEMIYSILDAQVSYASINGMSGMIQDAFEAINNHPREPELRDMAIIFYLQNIESIEMASFQILQMAAVKLGNKHVSQLLKENYSEAKADRTLLLLLSTKYMTG